MIKKLFFLLLIILASVNCGILFAQPGPGPGPMCFPPPCIPIDGGIGFLIAAGIAFGMKKTVDMRKKKEVV